MDLIAKEFDARTVLVDSMQVYREIPEISNQRRERPASLCAVASVTGEWSVARHRDAALEEMRTHSRNVLDAGTGMYLNAILFDFPLAPKVPKGVRAEAESLAESLAKTTPPSANPRRLSRELELKAIGRDGRRSVWDGNLRFETYIIYLRPNRETLDRRILARSRQIVENGAGEAKRLLGIEPTPTVRDAIGVREMLLLATGEISPEEATQRISTRTRRLARRQMRWFDKLTRTLKDRATIVTIDNTNASDLQTPRETINRNCIHDIIDTWK